MPANEPILWTIQTSLKTALENISAGATYFYTASTVEHRENENQQLNRGDFIVGLNNVSRESDETQGKYYYRAQFDVTAIIAPDAAVEDDQARARLWSDVQAAVMADPQRTVSSVRYAIDTQVLSPDIQDQYDERVGITVPVEVYYRTSITDPTSL